MRLRRVTGRAVCVYRVVRMAMRSGGIVRMIMLAAPDQEEARGNGWNYNCWFHYYYWFGFGLVFGFGLLADTR